MILVSSVKFIQRNESSWIRLHVEVNCSYHKSKLVCSMLFKTDCIWDPLVVIIFFCYEACGNVVNVLKFRVSRKDELLWLSHCGVWCWCVPKLSWWHLQMSFSQVDCASFPSPPGSCPQHRGGRKILYNWASIEIQRGLGSLHLIVQGSTLKLILPKWDVFCIFLQGDWGGENTKMLQCFASTLEILNQCSWRWHRPMPPSSSHQGRICPLCEEAGWTFRSCSGN